MFIYTYILYYCACPHYGLGKHMYMFWTGLHHVLLYLAIHFSHVMEESVCFEFARFQFAVCNCCVRACKTAAAMKGDDYNQHSDKHFHLSVFTALDSIQI